MSCCHFCTTQIIDYKVVERYTPEGVKVRRITCLKCYDIFDAIMSSRQKEKTA